MQEKKKTATYHKLSTYNLVFQEDIISFFLTQINIVIPKQKDLKGIFMNLFDDPKMEHIGRTQKLE